MKRLTVLLFVLLLLPFAAAGQDYVAPEVKVSADRVRVDGRSYYAHVVLERQTLYSIARAYEVSIQDIYDANPNLDLPTAGVKKGQVLLIPIKPAQHQDSPQAEQKPAPAAPQAVPAAPADSSIRKEALFPQLMQMLELGKEERDSSVFVLDRPEVIRVALLLPFKASGIADGNSLDFYAGALLAARDLGEQGIRLHIDAIDMADQRSQPGQALLQGSDVIIGPVGVNDINRMLELCPRDRFLISPLEPKAAPLAATHNVIQAPTPVQEQNRNAVRWALEEMQPGDSLFLIRQKDAPMSEGAASLVEALNASGRHYGTISYGLLQGRAIQSTFVFKATKSGTNRYLIASEDESFVNDAIRNINLMAYKKHDVALYGPSRLRSFGTVEVENLHNVQTRIAASYHIDYNDPEVKRFVMAYRALCQAEPSSFAFHGYDTFRYFVELCARYGRMWEMKLTEYPASGLQTDFRFSKEVSGGHVNTAVRRVVYTPEFKIEAVRARSQSPEE